jgi:hypothetical protein
MKKTRLLEIIREEISSALREGEAEERAAKAAELKAIDAKQKALDAEKKDTMRGGALEEEQLDEMAYNIVLSNPEELAKLKDKIKDSTKKGEQLLSQVIDIIQRDKKENKPIRQRDIANELGTIQQKINPLVNLLIDYGILSKGESVTGVTKKAVSDKPKAEKPAKEKPAKAETPKAEPKTKETKPSDDEEGPSAKDIAGDETAKELSNIPADKKEKFNLGLKFINKYKDDKPKIDAYLKKAKDEYKLPKTMMDDLKRAAGRDVE